ncbi:tRNA (adenosine(37)-N6)-dimethylallyltransferase MiaA [Feifania hominis]|uniref:tRNA dimethylallyltransferase n=1 Tax=Feifania hominis TaxID=2763660 RepID=A0A926DFF1_9FIRM|nr:tRNA (adenosine(37)-N6)-dimethylallyltransferase MiaA [Feifania hominis]MBC8536814.1 tRNA (adenosine(37)-N6)-dimethylallyltransferase MiaA [Feifania hominis]
MRRQLLPAVVGTTASGKTALAIRLAQRCGGEVVSADSMQIYRRMDIGTAKPTAAERREAVHHMVDIVEPGESFSTFDYVAMARGVIAQIAARGRLPILAGGTGLYVSTLLDGTSLPEMENDAAVREKYLAIAREQGNEALHRQLAQVDPAAAAAVHPNNVKRVARALEVYELTGRTVTWWNERSKREPSPYEPLLFGLTYRDRARLYEAIDSRVDRMVQQGLLDEVRSLLDAGVCPASTAFQAIGYKELAAHLAGACSFEQAVESVKRESRRYAKRQLTWFRRDGRVRWFYVDEMDMEKITENCQNMVVNHL